MATKAPAETGVCGADLQMRTRFARYALKSKRLKYLCDTVFKYKKGRGRNRMRLNAHRVQTENKQKDV